MYIYQSRLQILEGYKFSLVFVIAPDQIFMNLQNNSLTIESRD